MELQSDDGTQRFELPVSRTTLNSWAGLPMAMVEKSLIHQCRTDMCHAQAELLTLSIEEVVDANRVALFSMDRGLLEHLVRMVLWSNAHVLLAKTLDLLSDVGMLL